MSTKKASKQGLRYSEAKKREVVNFVNQYNKKNGRGGQAAAFKKYGIAVLSISNWLKDAAASAPVPAAPAAPAAPAKAVKTAKAPKAAKPAAAKKAAKPAAPQKAAKPAKTAKPAKPAAPAAPVKFTKRKAKVPQGTRYTPEEKQVVIDFVNDYNAKNGRGGMTVAARKFKITPLTVSAWLSRQGGAKPKAAAGENTAELLKKIAKLEATVARLKAKAARK